MKFLTSTWNPNYIRRNTIIQIVIVSLAFFLLIRVWPCNLVKNHTMSGQKAVKEYQGAVEDNFTDRDKKLQTVLFTDKHIHQITMYLSCTDHQSNDTVLFRLYNEEFSCIYEEEYSCSRIAQDHYMKVTPDMDVQTRQAYYYEVIVPENTEIVLNVPVADNSLLGQEENHTLYIDGIINDEVSLISDFEYTSELSFIQIIFYIFLILAVAVGIYAGILFILDKFNEYIPELLKYGKWIATGFGGMFAVVVFVFAVIRNIFGGESADRVVYTLGILAGLAWYMCLIWIPTERRKPSKLSGDRQISLIWRNYIQVVCFGFLFYALCMYVNADREYYHYTNTRWMLILLGIALLMIHSEKELMNIPTYIWTSISLIGSVFYCYGFEAGQEQYLARLTAAVVVIWGIVIINAFLHCKKKAWTMLYKSFALVWFVFAVLMIINRFQKTWPFTATLPFAVLLLYNLNASQKSRLLKNFVNGILLSFGLTVLFSLHHRPYHFWMRYRYNMVFHTVASTGMYLSTVFAAALGKLYSKWKDNDFHFQKCWKELFIFATVVCFVLFTMSRTAMITMAATMLMVIIGAFIAYSKTFKNVLKEIGVMVLVVVISFPLMFSAVRMIPALASAPVRYDIEPQDSSYMIYESDPINSDKYMNVVRFFKLFFNRFDVSQAKGIEIKDTEDDLLAYIGGGRLPITAGNTDNEYVLQGDSDISNGRFQIFVEYLKRLNLKGHPSMIIEELDDVAHAHNSYIQVAYDFGIITGIVFLILCVYTFVKSIMMLKKYGRKYSIYIIPYALVVNFGVMSLTEWAFHPCIPAGFCFLFVQMLLMQDERNKG